MTALLLAGLSACGGASRRGDTRGVQTLGRWEWHGTLLVRPDTAVTVVHMSIDTTPPDTGGDVVLVRDEFNPTDALGDEYAVTLGLTLGRAHDLRPGVAYAVGGPSAPIPGYGVVACMCRPLRPDSLRGTLLLATRGMRQLTGRIDATLYLSEWNAPTRHTTYPIHQRFDAIK